MIMYKIEENHNQHNDQESDNLKEQRTSQNNQSSSDSSKNKLLLILGKKVRQAFTWTRFIFLLMLILGILFGFYIIEKVSQGFSHDLDRSITELLESSQLRTYSQNENSQIKILPEQLTQAIRRLQITDNINFNGQIQLNMTKEDKSQYLKTRRIQKLLKNDKQYLDANYDISNYKKRELSFCIIVPSNQNPQSGLYRRNLKSIFMQDYKNYHVIYIDDSAQNRISEYVKCFMLSHSIPSSKIHIIQNQYPKTMMQSINHAIYKNCAIGQIAMIVRGSDALIGTNVLNLHNAVYHKKKPAMIYSNYLQIVDNSEVEFKLAKQIQQSYFKKKKIRTIEHMPAEHLISFYVDVYRSINIRQFKDSEKQFFSHAYERAIITPLLQLSFPRITVLNQILYEKRVNSSINWHNDQWIRQQKQILGKRPFSPLKFFPFIERENFKYFFAVPIDKMIQDSDFHKYTKSKNYTDQGISKQQHIRAIRMVDMVHSINFKGQIVVELTSFQTSKQQKQQRIKKLLEEDKKYFNQKYNIDSYKNIQLPFCIVTPSYNNVKNGLYLRNLDSLFMQDYKNYHIVYIDDHSSDNTGQYVKKYLKQKNIPKELMKVIINQKNEKALHNIYTAVHQHCNFGQIVAVIDGDDSFIGRNILSLFNAIYQKQKIAMAFSNFLTIHNNDRTQLGFCHDVNMKILKRNSFRKEVWDMPGTHLLTFYKDLFEMIKLSDLTYQNGSFFHYATDRAIITPMLQLSYPRFKIVKQITYQYRNDTGINVATDDWVAVSNHILSLQSYPHITNFSFIKHFDSDQIYLDYEAKFLSEDLIINTSLDIYKDPHKQIGINKQQHIQAIRLVELFNVMLKNEKLLDSLSISVQRQQEYETTHQILKDNFMNLSKKYNLQNYRQKQLPFCIVIPFLNVLQQNQNLKTIDSILWQHYKNYRIVLFANNLPEKYKSKMQEKRNQNLYPDNFFKVLKNDHSSELQNIHYSAHNQCGLDEFMLIINNKDTLIGRNVLSVLNALYQKTQAKVAYSCFLNVNQDSTELGRCADIKQEQINHKTLRADLSDLHYRLMSFETSLFRRIKIRDLEYSGQSFFKHSIDRAIMIPLIQMAFPNVMAIKEILYQNHNKVVSEKEVEEQKLQINIILGLNPYEPIKNQDN